MLCVDAVTGRRPLTAANLDAALYVCTIFSTMLIVERCFVAVAADASLGDNLLHRPPSHFSRKIEAGRLPELDRRPFKITAFSRQNRLSLQTACKSGQTG
jgi:hypothetical protein